ncbi:MAG: DNA translocase FtsK, partial [Bacilli bacterium]|nr:DNA translocase FtsK [Bacilli bacterium]
LSVTTAAESRIIIDEGGADTLVGKGDLLAKVPQYKMMIRLQSAYVSNQEIAAVVSYLKSKSKPCYNKDFLTFEEPKAEDASANFNNVGERALEDPLYNKVKEYVLETGACSTSAIQRMFGIGYSKAAFLLDGMEFEGYIKTTKNGRRIFVDDEE